MIRLLLLVAVIAIGCRRAPPPTPPAQEIIERYRARIVDQRARLDSVADLVARETPATAVEIDATPMLTFDDFGNATLLDESDLHDLMHPKSDAPCRFRYATPFAGPMALRYDAPVFDEGMRISFERSFERALAVHYVLICRTFERRVPTVSANGIQRGDVLLFDLSSGAPHRIAKYPYSASTAVIALASKQPEPAERMLSWATLRAVSSPLGLEDAGL